MLDSTKRSRDWLKERGFFTARVEQREYGGKSADLWGFVDLVALHPELGTLWVQACGSDFTAHVKKYAASDQLTRRIARVSKTPSTDVMIFSWRKEKVKKGGTAYVYKLHAFLAFPTCAKKIEWPEIDPETILGNMVSL